jgi:hypothetical protein
MPTPPKMNKAAPDVEPIPDASDRLPPLPLDDNPATMEAAPPLLADDDPAVIDVVPPTPSPEPMLITMSPPDSEADEPLTRLTSPLSPTDAIPALIKKLPLTPVVPALSVETLTAPKLVNVPMPEAMAMEPPKADNLPTHSLQKYDNQSAKQCMLPAGDDCKCSWFDANKNNNTQQSTGEDNQVAAAEVCHACIWNGFNIRSRQHYHINSEHLKCRSRQQHNNQQEK